MNTERDAEESIDRIFEAASREFEQNGFDGARMAEIARRAEVNKALIYYHVGNKQDLFTELLVRNLTWAERELAELRDSTLPPPVMFRRIVKTLADRAASKLPIRIVLREVASGGRHLTDPVRERIAEVYGIVRDVILQGQENGDFRECSPLLVHYTTVGSILFMTAAHPMIEDIADRAGESEANRVDLTENPDPLVNLLMDGLRAEPDPES